jgi:glycosyltransferase involved in cell wall biosynthesis
MKILHVFKEYHPVVGGIQNHIRILSEELVKDGNFEVEVLVTNVNSNSVTQYIDGIKVSKAGRILQIASTPISTALFKCMKKMKPDILHLHFPYPPGEIASLLSKSSDKIVLTYHSDIVKQKVLLYLYMPILKRVLEKAKAIVVSNPNILSSSRILNPYINKIEIIPFGIDIERFEKVDERKIQGIKNNQGNSIVLFVGRFCYYKGIEYLLEAAKEVDANFWLVGDGPLKPWIEDYIRRNNLKEKIHLWGRVSEDELPYYYHAADIQVLPSTHRSEAFGITLLEGMACNLPLITTELGTGTSFVNLNDRTGMVVPPSNSSALIEAINLMLKDKNLRSRFSVAAKERVKHEFSKGKMVKLHKALYSKILSS